MATLIGMPRDWTITRRKQLAQDIRNLLFDYRKSGVGELHSNPQLLLTAKRLGELAHLEGYSQDHVIRVVLEGWSRV